MDAFGYILFGAVIVVSAVITHYMLQYGKKYSERKVISFIENNPSVQQKIKDRFGWK